MKCSICPVKSKFCHKDREPSIRRQGSFNNDLRFVLSRPEPFFVDPAQFESNTSLIFKKFLRGPFDIVFTKNCIEAGGIEKKAIEREAVACCSEDLARDIKGAKVLVLCGEEALNALGYNRKPGSSVGWVDYNEELGCSVLATQDPHKVEGYPSDMFKDFIWTVQQAERVLKGEVPDRNILPEQPYINVESLEHFKDLVSVYPKKKCEMALDIETTGLHLTDPETGLINKGLGWKDPNVKIIQIGLYNPVNDPLIIPPPVFHTKQFKEYWDNEFLEGKRLIGWNFKFDGKFLRNKLGIQMPIYYDDQLTHQKVDERTGTHSMGRCALVYSNYTEYWLEIEHFYKLEHGLLNAPWEAVAQYLAHDLRLTFDQHQLFMSMLRDDRKSKVYPWKIFLSQKQQVENVIRPVVNELMENELQGSTIDCEELDRLTAEAIPIVEANKKEIEGHIFDLTGEEYSIDSSQQLLAALKAMEIFGPHDDSTKKKYLEAVIEKYNTSEEHRFLLREILAYKQMSKMLRASYLGSQKRRIETIDGLFKLFTTFNVAGTIGSRWTSTNPNLQQLPRKDKGPFKQIFIPRVKKRIIFQSDFSSLEARGAAYLSGDKVLSDACQRDLHQIVAEKSFSKFFDSLGGIRDLPDLREFTGENSLLLSCHKTLVDVNDKDYTVKSGIDLVRDHLRNCAKTITYGIFFGRGARALALQELNCSVEEAEFFVEEYFKLFPDLKRWIDKVKMLVRTEGIIITPCGCMRDLRAWKFSPSQSERNKALARAQRQAVNFLTQTFGGTLQNLAYAGAGKYLRKSGVGELRAGVHDSTVGELDFNIETRYHLNEIRKIQENVFPNPEWLCKTDTELGLNWGKLYKEDKFFELVEEGKIIVV